MLLIFRLFSPGRLLFLATIVVVGYLTFSAGTNFLHSYHLTGEESRLRVEVEKLQAQQDQLQQIRDYLRTDEYIEFMARRVFGLVKPGENLVMVEAPDGEAPPEESPEATWWQELFGQ